MSDMGMTPQEVAALEPEVSIDSWNRILDAVTHHPGALIIMDQSEPATPMFSVSYWARRTPDHYEAVVNILRSQYDDLSLDYTVDFSRTLIRAIRIATAFALGNIEVSRASKCTSEEIVSAILTWYHYEYTAWVTHMQDEAFQNVHILLLEGMSEDKEMSFVKCRRFFINNTRCKALAN